MMRCAKCSREIPLAHPRYFAAAPIGGRAMKCQGCGPFTAAENAFLMAKYAHLHATPQNFRGAGMRRPGGCGCAGRR